MNARLTQGSASSAEAGEAVNDNPKAEKRRIRWLADVNLLDRVKGFSLVAAKPLRATAQGFALVYCMISTGRQPIHCGNLPLQESPSMFNRIPRGGSSTQQSTPGSASNTTQREVEPASSPTHAPAGPPRRLASQGPESSRSMAPRSSFALPGPSRREPSTAEASMELSAGASTAAGAARLAQNPQGGGGGGGRAGEAPRLSQRHPPLGSGNMTMPPGESTVESRRRASRPQRDLDLATVTGQIPRRERESNIAYARRLKKGFPALRQVDLSYLSGAAQSSLCQDPEIRPLSAEAEHIREQTPRNEGESNSDYALRLRQRHPGIRLLDLSGLSGVHPSNLRQSARFQPSSDEQTILHGRAQQGEQQINVDYERWLRQEFPEVPQSDAAPSSNLAAAESEGNPALSHPPAEGEWIHEDNSRDDRLRADAPIQLAMMPSASSAGAMPGASRSAEILAVTSQQVRGGERESNMTFALRAPPSASMQAPFSPAVPTHGLNREAATWGSAAGPSATAGMGTRFTAAAPAAIADLVPQSDGERAHDYAGQPLRTHPSPSPDDTEMQSAAFDVELTGESMHHERNTEQETIREHVSQGAYEGGIGFARPAVLLTVMPVALSQEAAAEESGQSTRTAAGGAGTRASAEVLAKVLEQLPQRAGEPDGQYSQRLLQAHPDLSLDDIALLSDASDIDLTNLAARRQRQIELAPVRMRIPRGEHESNIEYARRLKQVFTDLQHRDLTLLTGASRSNLGSDRILRSLCAEVALISEQTPRGVDERDLDYAGRLHRKHPELGVPDLASLSGLRQATIRRLPQFRSVSGVQRDTDLAAIIQRFPRGERESNVAYARRLKLELPEIRHTDLILLTGASSANLSNDPMLRPLRPEIARIREQMPQRDGESNLAYAGRLHQAHRGLSVGELSSLSRVHNANIRSLPQFQTLRAELASLRDKFPQGEGERNIDYARRLGRVHPELGLRDISLLSRVTERNLKRYMLVNPQGADTQQGPGAGPEASAGPAPRRKRKRTEGVAKRATSGNPRPPGARRSRAPSSASMQPTLSTAMLIHGSNQEAAIWESASGASIAAGALTRVTNEASTAIVEQGPQGESERAHDYAGRLLRTAPSPGLDDIAMLSDAMDVELGGESMRHERGIEQEIVRELVSVGEHEGDIGYAGLDVSPAAMPDVLSPEAAAAESMQAPSTAEATSINNTSDAEALAAILRGQPQGVGESYNDYADQLLATYPIPGPDDLVMLSDALDIERSGEWMVHGHDIEQATTRQHVSQGDHDGGIGYVSPTVSLAMIPGMSNQELAPTESEPGPSAPAGTYARTSAEVLAAILEQLPQREGETNRAYARRLLRTYSHLTPYDIALLSDASDAALEKEFLLLRRSDERATIRDQRRIELAAISEKMPRGDREPNIAYARRLKQGFPEIRQADLITLTGASSANLASDPLLRPVRSEVALIGEHMPRKEGENNIEYAYRLHQAHPELNVSDLTSLSGASYSNLWKFLQKQRADLASVRRRLPQGKHEANVAYALRLSQACPDLSNRDISIVSGVTQHDLEQLRAAIEQSAVQQEMVASEHETAIVGTMPAVTWVAMTGGSNNELAAPGRVPSTSATPGASTGVTKTGSAPGSHQRDIDLAAVREQMPRSEGESNVDYARRLKGAFGHLRHADLVLLSDITWGSLRRDPVLRPLRAEVALIRDQMPPHEGEDKISYALRLHRANRDLKVADLSSLSGVPDPTLRKHPAFQFQRMSMESIREHTPRLERESDIAYALRLRQIHPELSRGDLSDLSGVSVPNIRRALGLRSDLILIRERTPQGEHETKSDYMKRLQNEYSNLERADLSALGGIALDRLMQSLEKPPARASSAGAQRRHRFVGARSNRPVAAASSSSTAIQQFAQPVRAFLPELPFGPVPGSLETFLRGHEASVGYADGTGFNCLLDTILQLVNNVRRPIGEERPETRSYQHQVEPLRQFLHDAGMVDLRGLIDHYGSSGVGVVLADNLGVRIQVIQNVNGSLYAHPVLGQRGPLVHILHTPGHFEPLWANRLD